MLQIVAGSKCSSCCRDLTTYRGVKKTKYPVTVAHLLVVGFHRCRSPVVDDIAQIALVDACSQKEPS